MKRITFLSLLVFLGCVENFDPGLGESATDLFFVDGTITEDAPAMVTVARPIAVGDVKENVRYIGGLTIVLRDDLGQSELLSEITTGIYQGSTPGVIGRSYSIEIEMPTFLGGGTITSSPQLIKPEVEVGDILIEASELRDVSPLGDDRTIHGVEVNAVIDFEDKRSTYYRWTVDSGTYQYTPLLGSPPIPCYVEDDQLGKNLFVLGESVSNERDLIKETILFARNDRKQYTEGYSLRVTQHSITKEAHDYWRKIEDQQENVGSIFDTPPAVIEGNLSFADDRQPVLGFFEASSSTSKRAFIDPLDYAVKPWYNTRICFPVMPPPPEWCEFCSPKFKMTSEKPDFWPK